MHPRNVYRNKPPNFQELALKYPEFRKHCKLDIGGKTILDFKCPEAIRVLTLTLLVDDFGLNVDLPVGCLVPRVPARLNYLLWLEDLLIANHYFGHKNPNDVTGIDIGTGASCIYPLLGHKQCGWNFVASDKDMSSVFKAQENVEKNNLLTKIKVIKVEDDVALRGFIDRSEFSEMTFDFCMCNPPFYDTNALHCADSSISVQLSDLPTLHSAGVCGVNYLAADSNTLHQNISHEIGCNAECKVNGVKGKEKNMATSANKSTVKLSVNKVHSKPRHEPHSKTVAKSDEVASLGGETAFVAKMIEDSMWLKDRVRIFTSMLGKKSSLKPLKKKLLEAEVAHFDSAIFCQGKTQRWALCWTYDPEVNLKITHQIEDCERRKVFKMDKGCTSHVTRLFCTAQRNTWSNQRRKRRVEKRRNNPEATVTSCAFINGNNSQKKQKLDNGRDSADSLDTIHCSTARKLSTDFVEAIKASNDVIEANPCPDMENTNFPLLEPSLKFGLEILHATPSDSGPENIFLQFRYAEGPGPDVLHQIVQFLRNRLNNHLSA